MRYHLELQNVFGETIFGQAGHVDESGSWTIDIEAIGGYLGSAIGGIKISWDHETENVIERPVGQP